MGKEAVFPELLEDPAYDLLGKLANVPIDQDVLSIHDNEDVSFSARNLLT